MARAAGTGRRAAAREPGKRAPIVCRPRDASPRATRRRDPRSASRTTPRRPKHAPAGHGPAAQNAIVAVIVSL
ncbi:hypothetical protein AQ611_13725 [Burkholderia singularis]|nr:hypothetical protein AQ611_13725 [Burkholderia sp. Bp7605]